MRVRRCSEPFELGVRSQEPGLLLVDGDESYEKLAQFFVTAFGGVASTAAERSRSGRSVPGAQECVGAGGDVLESAVEGVACIGGD
ncbi:hypothetical protein NONO_c52240 [Nocardia nova SH22a]|uniref:Uncharacterized protein n=1 Tax=Nocardia nova SH22a TaxID=1415166 RepID=W5TM09_9NOCA|nr:hypothetical protein [Nocardia nova]AHH20008.1 hypothetical protein NONO_c52240 [Nocardia nova SH22a]